MMQRFAFVLLLAISAVTAESNIRAGTHPSYAAVSSHQRSRELGVSDWWYTILNHLHVPCPHGHTDDHKLGHCAHHSFHPSGGSHKSGGSSSGGSSGGSSSGGSSGGSSSGGSSSGNSSSGNSSSGCTGDDCTQSAAACEGDDCTDNTTDCEGDDCTADMTDCECQADDEDCDCSGWGDDGHTDDTTDDATDDATDDQWGDDGHTDDTSSGSGYGDGSGWNNGWKSNNYSASTSGYNSADGGSGNGTKWGIGALVACVVGVAAFVAMRKRKSSNDQETEYTEGDVYVEGTPSECDAEEGNNAMEMRSVNTKMTRGQSIKSAISRGGQSLRSKFSRRSRSGGMAQEDTFGGDYENDGFDDEYGSNDGGGMVM